MQCVLSYFEMRIIQSVSVSWLYLFLVLAMQTRIHVGHDKLFLNFYFFCPLEKKESLKICKTIYHAKYLKND